MKMNDMQALAAYGRFDKSVLVSAGAGSGKTQVLTTRVAKLIEDHISPLNLLVLTFTNAAAAEMKGRVRSTLSKNPEMADTLPLLEQAYITTFDSFNLSICKKYYYALNISPNISICDSDTMKAKKIEIITDILDDLYESKNELLYEYLDKFTAKKDDSLISYILRLIDSLDKKEDPIVYLNSYLDNFYSDSFIDKIKNDYLSIIESLFQEYANLIDELLHSTDNEKTQNELITIRNLCAIKDYKSYQETIAIALPRKNKNDSDYFSMVKEMIKPVVTEIKSAMVYDSIDEMINEYMDSMNTFVLFKDILLKYYNRIAKFSKEFNVYEFNDIQHMAISLVKNNIDIRNELKAQFKEILIDEYQDTSDLQEIFISYFQNDNLFMVGDIKQSIYRFRNANPNIFKMKYETYARINKDNYPAQKDTMTENPGYLIDMNQNFRSRREVLEDINNMFSLLMSSEVGDADYKNSHLMEYGLTLYDDGACSEEKGFRSDFITYPYDKRNSKVERAYYEAYIIAMDIKKKLNNYQVYSKADKGFHLATYDDFCIILDRQKNFDIIRQVLEFYGIPVVIYMDKNISESYVAMTIINLLKLVGKTKLKEFDSDYYHALTGILRSFLYEYSDEAIFDIVSSKNLDNDASNKAYELSKKIDIIANHTLYQEILDSFDFYNNVIKVGNVNESLHEAEYLFNKTKDLSAIGYKFSDIAIYLSDLISSSDPVKYALDVTSSHGVKMMNIHKSKGLEYPICYFGDFNHKYNSDNLKSPVGLDSEYGLYVPIDKGGIKNTVIKTLVSKKFISETISERLRLFYVAVTRAREKMIFIRDEENVSEGISTSKHSSFGQYFDYVLDKSPLIFGDEINLSEEYFIPMLNTDYQAKKEDTSLRHNERLQYRPLNIVSNKVETSNVSKRMKDILNDEVKAKLETGTRYHEVLEMLDFTNLEESLNSLKLDSHIYKVIDKVIHMDIFKDIANAKTYHEHEFTFNYEGKYYHGIIDLLVEYNDHFDIIDYKLKNMDDEAYQRQINIYASYVRSKSDKKINGYLLSILDGDTRRVEIK